VDLDDQAGVVQGIEVAANRHLAHVELGREVDHAGAALAPDLAHDEVVALARERGPSAVGHRVEHDEDSTRCQHVRT
jgi:hypothetical protein